MTPPRGTPGRVRVRTAAVSLVLAAAVSACASSGVPLPHRPAPGMLPPGSPLLSGSLNEGDAWLRQYVMSGDHGAALDLLRRSAERPRDALLRSLQEAVVLHHAGRYAESNARFEWAEVEADRRWTRSVSRNLGAFVINDRVLPYLPSPSELAIVPYYRMLNYLAVGDPDGAAVEARKSAAYLARLRDRGAESCDGFGLVEYLAGLAFIAAGERNDALVSMRQAERSFSACGERPDGFAEDLLEAALALGITEVADSVASRYGLDPTVRDPSGAEVVVFIEHGFAAHRAQQDVVLPIFTHDLVAGEDASPSTVAVAGLVTARLAGLLATGYGTRPLWEHDSWNTTRGRHALPYGSAYGEVAHLVRLSWPVMRLEASRTADVRIVHGEDRVPARPLEDVSARVVREMERQRNTILARMAVRGVAKYVIAREAGDAVEREGGRVLGTIVGLVTNAAGNALEQADTRSWSLLPDQIAVARVRVPAGAQSLSVEVVDRAGIVAQTIELAPIELRPGDRRVVSHRVWGPEAGDRERLIDIGTRVYAASDVPPPPREYATPARSSGERRRVPAPRPAPPAIGSGIPAGAVPVGTAPPPPIRPPGG
jgi:uncharacterized protein